MFYHLDHFHENFVQKAKFGISLFECEKAVLETCNFLGIPVPRLIKNMTEHPGGRTMFSASNRMSYADDAIYYNLRELKKLGIKDVEAFELVMTHEAVHRMLQNTTLPGIEGGKWEEELCCDFFIGVRAGMGAFSRQSFDAVRNGLLPCGGSRSHPTGKLRHMVISYAYTYVGSMDLIQGRQRTFEEYLAVFDKWRIKHIIDIQMEQALYY